MSILDLRGLEFLGFYVLVLIGALALAGLLRWLGRGLWATAMLPQPCLSAFEAALMTGGTRGAVNAAIVGLLHRKMISIDSNNLLLAAQGNPANLHPLERAVYDAVRDKNEGATIRQVYSATKKQAYALRQPLADLNLVLSGTSEYSMRLITTVIAVSPLLVGVPKIMVGLSRYKPVGFLCILCLITAWAGIRVLRRPLRVTRRGLALLNQLREEHASLSLVTRQKQWVLEPEDLSLAVALFGAGVLLVGGPYSKLARILPFSPDSGKWLGSNWDRGYSDSMGIGYGGGIGGCGFGGGGGCGFGGGGGGGCGGCGG